MTRAQSIQILARDNGAGLSRDLDLMQSVLTTIGASSTARRLKHRGALARCLTRLSQVGRLPRYAVNIMLERIRPEFLSQADINVFIPNPEYIDEMTLHHLNRLDAVWCKTHHAVDLLKPYGVSAAYLGFSSSDRWLPAIERQDAFFHGPGRSNNKGTYALIDLWRAHPEWPTLTIVWRRKHLQLPSLPPNIQLITEFMDDDSYRRLQNTFRFHLCPSQTEGYGHYIVEAMSCQAVVVTLDAPPMNELITPDRGILASARPLSQQGLATTWDIIPESFSQAIKTCLSLNQLDKQNLGHRARAWYLTRLPLLQKATAKLLASVNHE